MIDRNRYRLPIQAHIRVHRPAANIQATVSHERRLTKPATRRSCHLLGDVVSRRRPPTSGSICKCWQLTDYVFGRNKGSTSGPQEVYESCTSPASLAATWHQRTCGKDDEIGGSTRLGFLIGATFSTQLRTVAIESRKDTHQDSRRSRCSWSSS